MIYKAEVIIYNEKKYPIQAGYRPHVAPKNTEILLGIEFLEINDRVRDKSIGCMIRTSYKDVDYSILRLNETYDVREGKNVVGEIVLKKLITEDGNIGHWFVCTSHCIIKYHNIEERYDYWYNMNRMILEV